MNKPCLAITLIVPREPEYASSYHWCARDEHPMDELHSCYCGIDWQTDDLVEPTVEMIQWRSGSEDAVRGVSGRMLG